MNWGLLTAEHNDKVLYSSHANEDMWLFIVLFRSCASRFISILCVMLFLFLEPVFMLHLFADKVVGQLYFLAQDFSYNLNQLTKILKFLFQFIFYFSIICHQIKVAICFVNSPFWKPFSANFLTDVLHVCCDALFAPRHYFPDTLLM